VQSPTFAYLNIYAGTKTIYHFDLYRLKNSEEFLSMGFDEYFEAKSNKPYNLRFFELNELLTGLNMVRIVETKSVNTIEEARAALSAGIKTAAAARTRGKEYMEQKYFKTETKYSDKMDVWGKGNKYLIPKKEELAKVAGNPKAGKSARLNPVGRVSRKANKIATKKYLIENG
jgi:hypothetical protein